jgi:hypothetical protein
MPGSRILCKKSKNMRSNGINYLPVNKIIDAERISKNGSYNQSSKTISRSR